MQSPADAPKLVPLAIVSDEAEKHGWKIDHHSLLLGLLLAQPGVMQDETQMRRFASIIGSLRQEVRPT